MKKPVLALALAATCLSCTKDMEQITVETQATEQTERAAFRSSTADMVINIVSNVLAVPAEELNSATNLREDTGADSIDLVELIMELEREFDITIPDTKVEGMETVGDLIYFIEDLTA